MSRSIHEMFADRRRIHEQLPTLPLAYSSGGGRGHFTGPLDGAPSLAGLVVVERDDGRQLVAQVLALHVADRPLGEIESTAEMSLSNGMTVQLARATPSVRIASGDLAVLGWLEDDRFIVDPSTEAFDELLFRTATGAEVDLVLAALGATKPMFEVGTIARSDGLRARLRPSGFARHTFLCGQSGSGKTYATGTLLERLRLATTLPIIVLDPNSDHIHLGETLDASDDDPDAVAYRALSGQVLVARGRGRGGDHLLALNYSDLEVRRQAMLLGLDPVRDLALYATLREIAELLDEPYSLDDLLAAADAGDSDHARDLSARIRNLGIAEWGVWTRPGEPSLVDAQPFQAQTLVLDLGSLDSPAERTLIAMATMRVLWRLRENKRSVLLVVDEAHNVFPAEPSTPLEAAATEVGISIAAEGRKYGLHLFVATQRPSKVHANVVTQCDNLALLRVNSVADVEDLCRIFSHVPPDLIRQAPGFTLGDVLFAGPIAPLPMVAKIGRRLSPEGGGDVPTDWAEPPGSRP